MATRAQLETQIKNLSNLYIETLKFASENPDNWRDMETAYFDSLKVGSFREEQTSSVRGVRSSLETILSPSGGQTFFDPLLDAWREFLGIVDTGSGAILLEMRKDFLAEPATIKSRDLTLAQPVADGGNVGNGRLYRLNEDADGVIIESQHLETKTAEIITAANNGGVRNQETFRVTGKFKELDDLLRTGSDTDTTLGAVSSRNSQVLNGGFDSFSPIGTPAAPDDILNWESDIAVNGTNYEFDSTNIFHPLENANDSRFSLRMKVSAELTQRLDLAGFTLPTADPLHVQIAFNREVGGGTGTLEIAIGATVQTVTLAAQTGWNVLTFALGTKNWWKAATETNPEIRVKYTKTGGTFINIDDYIVTTFTRIDGAYLAAVGGTIAWLREDEFTWSSVLATVDSIIQRILFLLYGEDGYLPHSATPTITDP